jgi:hypothetical protein
MIKYLIKTFPNIPLATYISTLDKALEDCTTVLDVGCGDNSPFRFISKGKISMGVDGFAPAIKKSKKLKIHTTYKKFDIRLLNKYIKPKKFDAAIALDVIEHLKKSEGEKMLKNMEKIARKKVIIFTPNGFIPQYDKDNKLQTHLSGWSVNDFKKRGYTVFGMSGWKPLRGDFGALKYKPAIVSGVFSELSHYIFTRSHPDYSFALFAVKDVENKESFQ